MKTAISLPDEIFAEADRVARRLRKTRSELYRDALAEYLARHSPDAVTEAMDRALADIGVEQDRFVSRAAKRVLTSTQW
jgi:metal-responsive CopG/Arc/MetJ family transcriptional regulator